MKETTFHLRDHLLFALLTVLTLILCIGVGSVSVPFRDTAEIIFRAIAGWEQPSGSAVAIILYTRLPRVLCVALVGAMLALGGCAMQGLLRNPLADGSTLGVSSGASLGAALAILSGVSIPFLPFGGTAGAAMLSAFLSLVVLLALAFALDHSLATNTLILLGVVFSMFVSALLSLLITFSGDKLRAITFWTMGNLSSASYQNALTLLATLLLCGGIILTQARALNAMSMGEEYALHVGVSVRRVKLTVMICVSAMIGMSVSVGGGRAGHAAYDSPDCRRESPPDAARLSLRRRDFPAPRRPHFPDNSRPGSAARRRGHVHHRRGGVSCHLPADEKEGARMNLSAEHVSVLRGRIEIVHDVSFSVSDGQWLMICGPNGAGKSTLLSAVSQELPYTGLVTLDGTDLRRMKPRPLARRMAMLRQLSDLAYAYTVEEVVSMGRYAHRGLLQADNSGAEAVERALQAVQLQNKRRQNILTLSGGERQRMLLAQVLCQEPDVLLLDEPGNHLDLRFQQELFLLIDAWRREPGHAVVSVVHDLSLARKFGTHALLLSSGRGTYGEISAILTPSALESAWQMDVVGWLRSLGDVWQE